MRPAVILLAREEHLLPVLFRCGDVRDSASETSGDDGSGVLGV
jgi:hypothetical protein